MVHTEVYRGHIINIDYDRSECNNPREDDNMGTMVCYHSRYNLGDPHTKDNAVDTVYRAKTGKNRLFSTREPVISLPLFLYDHSGLSISTTSFIGRAHQAEWDSGRLGWIFITHKKVREEFSVTRITKRVIERVKKQLYAEVDLYDAYLGGRVFYFQVLDETGEEVESVGGFLGDYDEDCLADARSTVDWAIADREEEDREKQETGLGYPPWTTA